MCGDRVVRGCAASIPSNFKAHIHTRIHIYIYIHADDAPLPHRQPERHEAVILVAGRPQEGVAVDVVAGGGGTEDGLCLLFLCGCGCVGGDGWMDRHHI